jgi:deazaflavin-dependent oxidoreductase (nitroreductase family)
MGMKTTTCEGSVAPSRGNATLRAITLPFASISRVLAGRRVFPLWAILHHTGRTSGTPYATTVVALRTPDGFMIPLPFGDATQWAKNLLAAGTGSVRFAGRDYRIADPRVVEGDEASVLLPRWVRFASGRIGLRQFVRVRSVAS